MPIWKRLRNRSRSPSLPLMPPDEPTKAQLRAPRCSAPSITYLRVPVKKIRSHSLDMTAQPPLRVSQANSGSGEFTSPFMSPADSHNFSEFERSRSRSPLLSSSSASISFEGISSCMHCVYTQLYAERNRVAELTSARSDSSSEDDQSLSNSDSSPECPSGLCEGFTYNHILVKTQTQSSESNYEELDGFSQNSHTLTSTSQTEDNGLNAYLPRSFGSSPSFDAVNRSASDQLPLLSQPFHSRSQPAFQVSQDAEDNPPYMTVYPSSPPSSFSFEDDSPQSSPRRRSEANDLYKNVATLQVPSPRGETRASGTRRASFDERMMAVYRSLHNMPSNIKKAVYSKTTGSVTSVDAPESPDPKKSSDEPRKPAESLRLDWSEHAFPNSHIWLEHPDGENCFLDEESCFAKKKALPRKKCPACHIVTHVVCMKDHNSACKPTFREAGVRNYREQSAVEHHWIHKKRHDGKCKSCLKSLSQGKFAKLSASKSSKEVVAVVCSWCHISYHSGKECWPPGVIQENCTLGEFANVIIPPSWIIKISRKLAYKSSVKKFTRKERRLSRKGRDIELGAGVPNFGNNLNYKPFIIKPIPTNSSKKPLVVFVNPRSGGNQGFKLMQKFYKYLNPRQVFDITLNGPKHGLELYKKVPNLHILVCGGDGTAGWVLAEIDNIEFVSQPAVAVLPLGTGNDLARTLNWGSGYTDEPITKILPQIEESQTVLLDRWDIATIPRSSESDGCFNGESHGSSSSMHSSAGSVQEEVMTCLPISVMNNYFSVGADAQILLQFHESREADPDKFKSRVQNKMYFARAGGRDLLKRAWKDLMGHLTIVCDGVDYTSKIREIGSHCLLFLNIPNYSSGSKPWSTSNNEGDYLTPRHDDGHLEVMGFTSTQLATLQVGGHGDKICQCSEVTITTSKTIPMQVDGEPCRLVPSTIMIKRRNQAKMLMKQQKKHNTSQLSSMKDPNSYNRMRLQVSRIGLDEYERFNYDKDELKQIAVPLGIIAVNRDSDLERVREQINRLGKEMTTSAPLPCRRPMDKSSASPPNPRNSVASESSSSSSPVLNAATRRKASGDSSSSDISQRSFLPPSIQPLSSNWTFLDSTTALRFFRIDRGQEHLHYITDISSEDLYVLDPGLIKTPDQASRSELQRNFSTTSGDYKYDSATVSPPRSPLPETGTLWTDFKKPKGNPSVKIKEDDKMLVDAAKRGNLKQLAEAHNRGGNLMARDTEGMSVLHNAARFNSKDIVQYVIHHAPKEIIDMLDKEKGQTALHKAAWYQNRTICRMLIQAGADLTIKDKQGNTAKSQANRADDQELENFLNYQEMIQCSSTNQPSTEV